MIPGWLAGRAGPDREPWDLARLRAAGVRAVLSVNDGLLCHEDDFAKAGIAYACVPLSANAPPLPRDEDICAQALPQACAFVQAQLAQRRPTRLTADEAIKTVRKVRPIALSAAGWEEFAVRVLGR